MMQKRKLWGELMEDNLVDGFVYDGNLPYGLEERALKDKEEGFRQTLKAIAGATGHELNNQLTPILGSAQLLEVSEGLSPQQREYVSRIIANVITLTDKIKALVSCLEDAARNGSNSVPTTGDAGGLTEIVDITPYRNGERST